MKKSELRQIIREEIKIIETEARNEDIQAEMNELLIRGQRRIQFIKELMRKKGYDI